jgi:hypothetical protein
MIKKFGQTGLNTQWKIVGKERDSRETERERGGGERHSVAANG